MKIYKNIYLFCAAAVLITVSAGAAELSVQETHRAWEKTFSKNTTFKFNFDLVELKGSKKAEDLVKKFVYNNKKIDDYMAYKAKQFTSDASKNKAFSDRDDVYESYYNERTEIPFLNDNYVIVQHYEEFYKAPAAHGSHTTVYYIVDVNKKRLLKVNDIVKDVPVDELKKAIGAKYKNFDFAYNDTLWPSDTLTFDTKGLVLFWNEYSIAPYSSGPIEVVLPFSTVERYFTPQGIELQKSFLIH